MKVIFRCFLHDASFLLFFVAGISISKGGVNTTKESSRHLFIEGLSYVGSYREAVAATCVSIRIWVDGKV